MKIQIPAAQITKIRHLAIKGGSLLAQASQRDNHKPAQATKSELVTRDTEDAFRESLPGIANQLLGSKFNWVKKAVGKITPEHWQQLGKSKAFTQMSLLAERWAAASLRGEFAVSEDMTLDERMALAEKVSHENRLLAAAGGGITGMTGFAGLLGDVIWLMLISLKSIYQISAIMGKPLSGEQGSKEAYYMLSNTDLSSLSEKQSVMLSMNTFKQVAQSSDLRVIQGLIESDANGVLFKNIHENIIERFNLEKSMGFLTRVLPIATGITGAAYSVYVINEVCARSLGIYSEPENQ